MARRNPATGRPPGRPKKTESIDLSNLDLDSKDIPPVPSGLNEDGELAWRRIWAAGSHLDKNADFLIVQELCFLIDETALMRRALSLGNAGGGVNRTYRHSNGSIVVHPYVNQLKDNRAMIMSWFSGIGFGATERTSIADGAVDPMAAFNSSVSQINDQLREMMTNG